MNLETLNSGNKIVRRQLNKVEPFFAIKETPFQGTLIAVKGPIYSPTYNSWFSILDGKTLKGDYVSMIIDGGLRGALKMAGLMTETLVDEKPVFELKNKDMMVEIVFDRKIEVDGKPLNQYKVFEISLEQ
jgi:hypothetical protein